MPEPASAAVSVRVRELRIYGSRFDDGYSRTPEPFDGLALDLIGRRFRERKELMFTPAFAPAIYRPGARCGLRAVLAITALVLPYNEVSTTEMAEVRRALAGLAHVLYTAWAHRHPEPEHGRYRLVLFLSRPLRPAEYNEVWAAANKRLARKADLSAHGMAQPWFVPCRAPDRRRGASLVIGDGRLFDVDRALGARG